jgi:hypothetical protein
VARMTASRCACIAGASLRVGTRRDFALEESGGGRRLGHARSIVPAGRKSVGPTPHPRVRPPATRST